MSLNLKAKFDKETVDYRRLCINKGWKSKGKKRGYLCKHDDKGVWVREFYHDRNCEETFVPWEEVYTVTVGNCKLFDLFWDYTIWGR